MATDKKILADTNIILYLLNGNEDIKELLQGYELFISVITELEILRFPSLSDEQFRLLSLRLQELKIVEINKQIKEQIFTISRKRKIKLTDCIIAATAAHLNIPLITADKTLSNIPSVNTIVVNI